MADILRRRNLLKNVKTSPSKIIPTEYQQVEYIESTGVPWIDTGIYANVFASASAYFRLRFSLTQSKTQIIFGCFTHNNYSKQIVIMNTGKVRHDWAGSGIRYFNTIVNTGEIHECKQENGVFYVDEEGVNITFYTINNNLPVSVFARSNLGGGVETGTKALMRLYELEIKDENGIVLADYVPCYRKSDGQVGVYDFASDGFKTSADASEVQFIAGGNV